MLMSLSLRRAVARMLVAEATSLLAAPSPCFASCSRARAQRKGVFQKSAGSMASIRMEKQFAIASADQPKVVWSVKAESVDGVELVSLGTTDRGFQRFVSGSGTGLAHSTWLAKLKRNRYDKTVALADVGGGGQLFGNCSRMAKTQQRKQCLRMVQMGTLPNLITLDLPAFEYDGRRIDGIQARCKTSLDIAAPVAIEATPFVIEYVKYAILAARTEESDEVQNRKRANNKEPKHVYWKHARGCYLARRTFTTGDKRSYKYKSFKPDGDSEESMRDCEQKAERWAAGEDDALQDDDSADGTSDDDADVEDASEC